MAPDRIGSDQGLFYIYLPHVAMEEENTVEQVLSAFTPWGELALFPCPGSRRSLGLSDLFLKNLLGVSHQVTTASPRFFFQFHSGLLAKPRSYQTSFKNCIDGSHIRFGLGSTQPNQI
jgi:hypothetical protein